MIPEKTRKRLEEAAKEYALKYEDRYQVAIFKAHMDGAEWMFKEAGGDIVLKEMRRMIMDQVKEILQKIGRGEKWAAFERFMEESK